MSVLRRKCRYFCFVSDVDDDDDDDDDNDDDDDDDDVF